MRPFEWDKSVEDLCSSQEEIQELKKVASLLRNMPGARSSSSFQAELKARLMEKALSEDKHALEGNKKENKVLQLINKGYRYSGRILQRRPLFIAAAAVLVIISMAVFYSQGEVKPPYSREMTSPEKPSESSPEITIARNPGDMEAERDPAPADVEQEPADRSSEESNDTPGEAVPEKTTTPEGEPPAVEGPEEDPDEPGEPEASEGQPVKDAPDFEAWKNQQDFTLAGQVKLSPVYYKVGQDAAVPAESVSCSWSPRKIVVSTDPGEAGIFGTQAWAEETLSNNGFIVREGDYLEINLQETQKGLFAEVFYRPQKSAAKALTLVLHCQDGAGILSYYYEEKGEASQPGFYPLLSPAEAFKKAEALKWYAPSQRLDFSFQEVVLTYHDFLLEENGRQEKVKLPAYCFLGRETIQDGGEFNLLLPAVRR